jgi:hypothetical protein
VNEAARWREANLAYNEAVVAEMTARLVGRDDIAEHRASREAAARACDPEPALDALADAFLLTDFEREIAALALAAELRPEVRAACGGQEGATPTGPSFAIATRVLDASHWSALSPGRPLRAAALVEIGSGPLPDAPIQLTERVLHHLLGVDDLDAALAATSTWLPPRDRLIDSHESAATEIVDAWRTPTTWPIVRVDAARLMDGRQVVARAATLAGCAAHVVRAVDLPADAPSRSALARAWRRELILSPRVLVVSVEGAGSEPVETPAVATFLDAVPGPVILVGGSVDTLRSQRRVAVALPDDEEQRKAWTSALERHVNGATLGLAKVVDRAVGQFRLGAAEIEDVATGMVTSERPAEGLWEACRERTRPALDPLGERVASDARWDDLVLPDSEQATLQAIARHVAYRMQVQRAWGTRAGARGRGIAALFHGPSGTGKTLAAEVIANEAGLDLYRIDLSSVVSKYIGETEKNLRRVFDAAEEGGAVLLFDEADALFGKRTEVRDSHDRYANIEVSYLLTRMETYRGLAILTTNVRSALDAAFLRRLRFVVAFPFPDERQRAEIWRRVFPLTLPTVGLKPERLARLGVTGATIHGIAVHASYEAAADRGPVTVEHVVRAAARELAKLDRPISQAELAGLR